MHLFVSLVLIAYSVCVYGQQFGPVPPQPQHFAGATLIQPPRANFRPRFNNARPSETIPSSDHFQTVRSRRPQILRKPNPLLPQQQILEQPKANLIEDVPAQFPNAAPTPLPQFQQQLTTRALTPRPVQEEVHEEEEIRTTLGITPTTTTFTSPIRTSYTSSPAPFPAPQAQVPAGFQKPQLLQSSAFRAPTFQAASPVQVPDPALPRKSIIRQPQIRPVPQAQLPIERAPALPAAFPQISVTSPPALEEEYFRQVQARPLKKQEPVRQQIIDREQVRQFPTIKKEVLRQQIETQQDYSRPIHREPHVKAPEKEKKPVAQTIRKYHEEHEDGSITWGYENDDGSFKEETIGVDCVTRGKYGYFDPDGIKREYTYQTGIPCVKAQENEEAASDHGYIDYTNNKYVLPNGDEIDLEAMVKNRARKPVSQFRIRP